MNHFKLHITVKSGRYIERAPEFFQFYNQSGLLSELKKITDTKPTIKIPIRELVWILDGADININKKFSLVKPIPVIFWNGKLTALAELDHLAYAQRSGVNYLPAKLVSPNELASLIRMPKIARELELTLNLLPESFLIPVDLLEPLDELEEVECPENIQKLIPPPPTTSKMEV